MRPEGPVLAFDTAAAHCAAVLVWPDGKLGSRTEPMDRGQAERLFPLLHELQDEHGIRWTDISAIGVGTGPGNFTGIRIAVAAARGLALSLGVPAIGVTAFERAASEAFHAGTVRERARVEVRIDLRFGRTGMQNLAAGPVPAPLDDPRLLDAAGDATAPEHEPACIATDTGICDSRLASLGRLAMSKSRSDPPPSRPLPLYLRPADAIPRK